MQPVAVDPKGNAAPAGGFQNNGWYSGYNYWNGQFAPVAGEFVQGNPNGKGAVSQEVAGQTNPNNVTYLNNERANAGASPLPSVNDNPALAGLNGGTGDLGFSSIGGQPAIPNLSDIYAQTYTNNPDVKAAQQKVQDLETAYATETKNINDNPFYAEATRTGKLGKLDQQHALDIQEPNNIISNAQAEAQRQVALAQGQYSMENQAWQQNIQLFNSLVSQGALDNADPATIAKMSVATGLPTSVLSNIASAQGAKYTQLVTSTDNSGNVTVTAVNSKTGKIINTTSLGAVGAAKVGKGADGNGLTKDDYINYLIGDITNGADLKSLVQHYQTYLPIATIYSQYGSNSPYGAPKETLQQVKSGQFADQKGFVSKAKPTIN